MSAYVPPFRRAEATSTAGEIPVGQAPPPSGPSSQRFNNRGRGPRGGRGGPGRGGFHPQGHKSIHDPDAYSMRDIANYFWPDEDYIENRDKSSTFHESAAHPEDLSYIFLFSGANPRWETDGIIFAKSKLHLLPEYMAKKAEHGPWPTEETLRGSGAVEATDEAVVVNVQEEKEKSLGGISGEGSQKTTERSSAITETPTNQKVAPKGTTDRDNTQSEISLPLPPSQQANINTIPASEFYKQQSDSFPSYPSIPPIDYTPRAHVPVAVFAEQSYPRNIFTFAGWYSVARVNILAPRSAELVRMQQQKWERRNRFGDVTTATRPAGSWKTSMEHEWAVIKFERLGEDVAPPVPVIEKLPSQQNEKETRGVTEMLQGIRLEGSGQGNMKSEQTEQIHAQRESSLASTEDDHKQHDEEKALV